MQGDCYYRGYVEGASESLVTLNTCAGLRGLLQIESLMYNIEPVEDSSTFQHVLYRSKEDDPNSRTCWLNGTEIPTLVAESIRDHISRKQDTYPGEHSKYLELFIQVEVQLYRHYSDNVLTTTQRMVQLSQMVDDMFSALGLRILLVGLGIRTDQNLAPVTSFVDGLLAFNEWRIRKVVPRLPHDAALLLAYHRKGPLLVTRSLFGTLCDVKRALAFVSIRNMPLEVFTIAVAHELGHVIGIPDDRSQSCCCAPNLNCIMASEGPFGKKPLFSSCSAASYVGVISSGKALCLNNIPRITKTLTQHSCGNGIVDEGEECDCGDIFLCNRRACCLKNCRLAPRAVCTTEPCCKHCKAATTGTVCRKSTNECDLPEYCNGTSLECPPDVAVQDGTPCRDDGYCYAGTCSTPTLQCQKIFGKESQGAPFSCFEKVNSIGDRFGNCGGGGGGHGLLSSFQKCEPEHLLCGRVQCTSVKRLPDLDDNVTIVQTPAGNARCWGLGFPSGIPLTDMGAVDEGSPCGHHRICVNRMCLQISDLVPSNITCDPLVNCSGRGVCNSKHNCHCAYGWAPPKCLSPGYGGSIDSGPAPWSVSYSYATLAVEILVAVSVGFVLGGFAILLRRSVWTRSAIHQESQSTHANISIS
ncbi:disintegrin and metalloproteinase domain-containing protein 9-like [Hemicordylus capensis]|uniref:disintegrin and metalloproteinase domain-containing protein 9-like n=1 Tax=Hemicordylus capensis TaxID=884348 RepID=UPI002302A5A5|nr:disintegrin and metalloproteinase domain-containing protein 9-like [Hemicordylus capensis]